MSVYNAYLSLSGSLGVEAVRDERLAHRTSYRIGGPAALSVTAHTYPALVHAIEVLDKEQVGWVVLGRGTNVLVSDKGYAGCVISLGREFSRISLEEDGQVSAGGSVLLSKLVNECQSKGLSGLEPCVGIPGTVGGAISMDAGTRDEWISRCISSVVTFRPGSGLVRYEANDIEWGYRYTTLPAGEIILEATCELSSRDPKEIAADMEQRIARRRRKQPMGKPTCGSVFRNPPGGSAGALVESCGLKGFSAGRAQVSETHANFVVNNGGATANDVLIVLQKMHEEVLERHGVDLLPEVKFLGFD
ncbi:MAG: UDP-N-acetylmuramate dehydrogenase [Atopobiaceae bacterium]|nr:UDP-N-acetylmuramate dehydrogenase [Atopobiaceae bacterium]